MHFSIAYECDVGVMAYICTTATHMFSHKMILIQDYVILSEQAAQFSHFLAKTSVFSHLQSYDPSVAHCEQFELQLT